jgi:hypothetical protein
MDDTGILMNSMDRYHSWSCFQYPSSVRLIALVSLLLIATACSSTADNGLSDSEYALGDAIPIEVAREAEGVKVFDVEEYDRARPLLKSEAEAGNPLAARYLGFLHLEGVNMEPALLRAAEAFHRGVMLGDAESQAQLAALYYQGVDVEANHQKTRHWFLLAAEQGHAQAQYALYNMLLQGLGGEIRPISALGWARLAKMQDYPGGNQAWENQSALISEDLADRIKAGVVDRRRPRYPRFDGEVVAALSERPQALMKAGRPNPARLQLRVGDKGIVQIFGVSEMESVVPSDGVMNPWLAYDVFEITTVIKQVEPQLRAHINTVRAYVMTEVAANDSKRLNVTTRAYRSN